ncbi:MAG TPA: hypothetical protein VMV62_02850 [Candidatus Paceibacterota bacterium]|nr:hypothetical protein [Candidatus Paceibacterota bacterium]
MNNRLIIGIFLTIAAAVLIAVAWLFTSAPLQRSAIPSAGSSVTPPSSGATTNVSAPGSSPASSGQPGTIAIGALGGGVVTTNDFIHNGATIPDGANTDRYLLAGNLGYCVSDPQQCQAASSTDFIVYYDSAQQSFTIALTEEPLGQARLDMERFMLATLGITPQQMCSLNYYVGTSSGVNALYSTKNLGFSFCPGATVLPQ